MTEFVRNFPQVQGPAFDLAIIGGGINGLAIAWDASLRGLRVLLVEKGDLGGATSAGCFKTIHGGLRYLQHLHFGRVFESMREQRTLRRIAPHLIRPLPFLLPCYGLGKRGRPFLETGMYLYDLLALGRNRGVPDDLRLRSHRHFSRDEVLRIAPGIPSSITKGKLPSATASGNCELRGGVAFEDCQMPLCERLTLAVARSAADAGGSIINYCALIGATRIGDTNSIDELQLRDELTGAIHVTRATVVVNAAGPWATDVNAILTGRAVPQQVSRVYSKGIQLVVPQIVDGFGIAVESAEHDPTSVVSRGGRSYFILPWRGMSIIGTTDDRYAGSPENFTITRDDVDTFVRQLQSAYQSDGLKRENVRLAFGGLLPTERSGARVSRDDLVVMHRSSEQQTALAFETLGSELEHVDNLITVVGVKYTTFRALAQSVTDMIAEIYFPQLALAPCRTAATALHGAQFASEATASDQSSGDPMDSHLFMHYGTDATTVAALAKSSPQLDAKVAGNVTAAEIVHAIRKEMAVTLADIVLRRTSLGAFGDPGSGPLTVAAQLAASELGWDRSRIESEVASTRNALSRGLV